MRPELQYLQIEKDARKLLSKVYKLIDNKDFSNLYYPNKITKCARVVGLRECLEFFCDELILKELKENEKQNKK